MHTDLLGLLYCLLHVVELLLLSGVSRENGELVELDAVLEGQPGLHAQALVQLTVNTYPRVLGVHFLYNLVPLRLRLTNNETMEQLVGLQGLHHCKFAGSLEIFLDCGEIFLCSSFSAFVLPSLGA